MAEPARPSSSARRWRRLLASIRRAYATWAVQWYEPLGDFELVVLAAATAIAVSGAPFAALAAGAAVVALIRRRSATLMVGVLAALVVVGAWRGATERGSLVLEESGSYQGWVSVVDDPQPYPSSTRVIVEVDGERLEVWARGRAAQLRLGEWSAGDLQLVSGQRMPLDAERQSRVGWQHVVGELDIDWVADSVAGSPIDRASNRVRGLIESAGAHLPGDDGSLYRGLVIGDDRDQPRPMIDRFRASGLSHLTAVSGQNVSFVLAAAGPLLRTMRPMPRWAVTLALIAWFVALTRFEPSIVRAGAMAALSATAFATGRQRDPVRILALAVIVLLLVDPMLTESIGWWLSVGATAGVIVIGPRLARQLQVFGPLATPIGITLGAQAGVVVPALLVFGRLPLVSLPANLLAVPVAGFVMLYGLPAGLLAGAVPPIAPLAMFPCRLGVRWVDTVAVLGERLEPSPRAGLVGWVVLTAVVMVAVVVNAARNLDSDERDPSQRQ